MTAIAFSVRWQLHVSPKTLPLFPVSRMGGARLLFVTYVDKVMDIIANTPGHYRLIVEGHTDDAPITSGKFRSNWDLASLRGI